MLTTLDIINDMIGSTGTAPLTSNDVNHPLYRKALAKLNLLNKSLQKRGWWYNRTPRTFTPNVSGEIILPSTCLSADPVDTDSNLVQRDGKLYDPAVASYDIGQDVEVMFVEEWPIEDMPSEPQDYLRCLAVYEFYLDEEGDGLKLSKYEQKRDTAWYALNQAELKHSDVNFFKGRAFLEYNTRRQRRNLRPS